MDKISELSRQHLSFETVKEGPQIKVEREILPWLAQDEQVRLKRIGLFGRGEFFLASLIRGERLVDAANQLDERRSRVANALFYTVLPGFINQDYGPHIKILNRAVTTRSIYYTGNPSGQRVYFVRLDNLKNIPVVLRIAACDKARQLDVLSVLTPDARDIIKRIAKL